MIVIVIVNVICVIYNDTWLWVCQSQVMMTAYSFKDNVTKQGHPLFPPLKISLCDKHCNQLSN